MLRRSSPLRDRRADRRTPWAGRAARALTGLGLAAGLLVATPPGAGGAGAGPAQAVDRTPDGWPAGVSVHSSDGVVGRLARPFPRRIGAPGARTVTSDESWQVVPGLTARRWTWTDARGPVRAQLLTLDLAQPGLALDHVAPPTVPARAPLTTLLAADGAVAGVNGDFFDIAETGAPLGVGRDRREGLRHAPASGWTRSFWLERDGTPRIGHLPLQGRVDRLVRGRWRTGPALTRLNSPTVPTGAVGAYGPAWGRTSGTAVTDGQRRRVREVWVRRGRVRAVRTRLSVGEPVRGTVLVARGAGARALSGVRPGTRVRVRWGLPAPVRVAVGGSVVLVRDGRRLAVDDAELHPRTAVGIDEDLGLLLLLVVDGRHATSRGLTMVELAEELLALGADQALNLDGGGSSTMVGREADGTAAVLNRPSDGAQRPVPNGLGITWTPPGR